MNRESVRALALVAMVSASGAPFAASSPVKHLDAYRLQGVEQADPERGEQLWYAVANQRGCTSCHGENPVARGNHVKTGKAIEPMAPSVNPGRFRSAKKIEKWFLRNCKWTWGRECSIQEKADILTWLAGQ